MSELERLTNEAYNPANEDHAAAARRTEELRRRKRPDPTMTARKLEVADRPGWKRHWFAEENVQNGLAKGYSFVSPNDVQINNRGIANATDIDGNQSLGDDVRVPGGKDDQGKVQHLVLMEIPLEIYEEDKRAESQANAQRLGSIYKGQTLPGMGSESGRDRDQVYVDGDRTSYRDSSKPLFSRPPRKEV